jgi:parallel beta-helix repeat protein
MHIHLKFPMTLSIALLSFSSSLECYAADYFVDVTRGKDTWSGTLSAPSSSATDGPWQSLFRVSSANLVPGDIVRLKCGQIWRETLKISSSGTPENPIRVSRFPDSCKERPIISATTAVPANAWVREGNSSIFSAQFPLDLLKNGSFSYNSTGWRVYSAQGDASVQVVPSCDHYANCLQVTSGSGSRDSIVYSAPFRIESATRLNTTFAMNAPSGTYVTVTVRRNAPPYDALGLAYRVLGTGSWKQHSLPFIARQESSNARLDFEIPPQGVTVRFDDVRIVQNEQLPEQLFVDGIRQDVAHYPNRQSTPDNVNQFFAPMPADANIVLKNGRSASAYAVTRDIFGVDLTGATIVLRSSPWSIEEQNITSYTDGNAWLGSPSSYPLKAGWGYLFKGQRWMLDEAGEWVFDPITKRLFVWMPDSGTPDGRVSTASRVTGVDASYQANVLIEGIVVDAPSIGVNLRASNNVTFARSHISDSLEESIDATGAVNPVIEGNLIERSGRDAISAYDKSNWNATGMIVSGNKIVDSSVHVVDGKVRSLPRPANAAIRPGDNATVTGNIIVNSAGNGIRLGRENLVENNIIENSCLSIDDCAAIYMNKAGNGSHIISNVISGVWNTSDGRPDKAEHGVGIYLDDLASNTEVRGNTVTDTDYGIQLHNAYNNLISNNTLFGNRRHQLWLQEGSRTLNPLGDLYGNHIERNQMVASDREAAGSTLKLQTYLGDVSKFATFSRNVYSSLLVPKIIEEASPTVHIGYAFPDWLTSRDESGALRNFDQDSAHIAPPSYVQAATSGNIIKNGDISSGLDGWHLWSSNSPRGVIEVEPCRPGNCLKITGGIDASLVSSPNFSVIEGQWYRVSFDMKSKEENQKVRISIRRGGGGGNNYQLVAKATSVTTNSIWQRYTFAVKSALSIIENDPDTLDKGARVDFENIGAGQTLELSNLEMVPVDDIDQSLTLRLLINKSDISQGVECPDAGINDELCSKYVSFQNASSVSWPHTLEARESKVIYTLEKNALDTDGDGIPDSQDSCAATPPRVSVNATGCSFLQSYP